MHQPRNKSVDEEGVAAALVAMVEVRKEWLERRDPPSFEVLSTSQHKPSKFQEAFSYPQVLHPLPSSHMQQSDRDLGQEHPSPSPAPAEMAASWDKGWRRQLQRRWAGQEARGGDREQAAGSTLVGAEARGVTRRERGGHCSLGPTHRTVQWDAGVGELSSPPLAAVLSGGKMHTVPAREGGQSWHPSSSSKSWMLDKEPLSRSPCAGSGTRGRHSRAEQRWSGAAAPRLEQGDPQQSRPGVPEAQAPPARPRHLQLAPASPSRVGVGGRHLPPAAAPPAAPPPHLGNRLPSLPGRCADTRLCT